MSEAIESPLGVIKSLIGISDESKDTILNHLIDNAKTYASDYCNIAYNEKLDKAVIKMVIEDYNKLGSEGAKSESYSGVSVSYADDYSPMVYKLMRPYKRIRIVGVSNAE